METNTPRQVLKPSTTIEIEEYFAQALGFDTVIDTRSPAEFAEDHLPGAINCPVLSNEERVEVGTLYKQVSPFAAKKLGAALVSRNIADHLQNLFADHPKQWCPMVYCWRGGTRSGAMTHILREVGWKAKQLEGGYKAYRRYVIDQLAELPKQFQYQVVCGETGSAKSRFLHMLREHGAQVLDLEALACHKGSVLGVLPDQPQPSQKMFESLVLHELQQMDTQKPVYIEAESKKIGLVRMPEALYEAMASNGKVIRLQASVSARVEFLKRDYDYFLADPKALQIRLDRLVTLHGQAVIEQWKQLAEQGRWDELVTELLVKHYDPAYRKSTEKHLPGYRDAQVIELSDLQEQSLYQASHGLLKA